MVVGAAVFVLDTVALLKRKSRKLRQDIEELCMLQNLILYI